MNIQKCKTSKEIYEQLKEAQDDEIIRVWESGELQEQLKHINDKERLAELNYINVNKKEMEIAQQIKELMAPKSCLELLFILLSIPFEVWAGINLIYKLI